MPTSMIIIKRDGVQTSMMAQTQAQNYLSNLINANRLPNLKQALNQAFNGQGKATGNYRFNNYAILHASSGNGQQSVSLFYYVVGPVATVVAMGEHVTSSSYKLSDYGQMGGSFAEKATITL